MSNSQTEKIPIGLMECDFRMSFHRKSLCKLIQSYMNDPMGGNVPHSDKKNSEMLVALESHSARLVLFATVNGKPVGVAVCFVNYSTFLVAPLLNIHDLVVLPEYRGYGIGKALLAGVELKSIQLGCKRITLEVREDNTTALGLYVRAGYAPAEPVMHYMRKELS